MFEIGAEMREFLTRRPYARPSNKNACKMTSNVKRTSLERLIYVI
jgi:hypothetical protein